MVKALSLHRRVRVLGAATEAASRRAVAELLNVDALRRTNAPIELGKAAPRVAQTGLPPLAALVDGIEAGGRRLVTTMGKGGVGKTTIAAAAAVELAVRGPEVC